ncbi:hypothetical protein N7E02_22750 [Aliirhizobium terrae]|uniref:SMI1/KNR4 family protein n=1 Tax=Terrirhizobium terrae TaxID=2926709 RepID=UPI002578E4C0|nr:SMI1/KNR4 family protein [Rhizobium sp. CC-CFT758]WJH39580.1 hypothetical protein N7E02_22750 [Rhizobium sp. CC-CFT758]
MSSDNVIPFRRPDALSKFATSSSVNRRYGAADAARLSAFEERYGIHFSDRYRSFLMRENGLDYDLSPEGDQTVVDDDRRDRFVLSDINTLFGIGNGHPYYDLEKLAPKMDFHDYDFTPFAHVIGLGGDFCTLVEISGGRYDGHIMYTDGELFSGFREAGIANKSTDEAVDYLVEAGYYSPIASDVCDLIAKYARFI